jgi:hypothetical protein
VAEKAEGREKTALLAECFSTGSGMALHCQHSIHNNAYNKRPIQNKYSQTITRRNRRQLGWSCVRGWACVCARVGVYVCMCARVGVYVCMCVCVCVCVLGGFNLDEVFCMSSRISGGSAGLLLANLK